MAVFLIAAAPRSKLDTHEPEDILNDIIDLDGFSS